MLLAIVPLVFRSPVASAVYNTTYVVWVASLIGERLIIYRSGTRQATQRSDRGSGLLIILSIFVSVLVAGSLAGARIGLIGAIWFYVGIAMMASGILVRLWAVSTLRNFFSYTVQIKEGHRVIQRGPYRFVRHPAYAGSLLTLTGVGFALQSWAAVIVIAAIFALAFGYRIRVEEKALVASLGDDYLDYSKKTKRLVPFIY